MAFPPVPVYPNAIDSDYTLFLVFNTTETKLCVENSAWAQEITIIPVAPDKPDIWADNGFGNVSGELFYYDSVERNEFDRVVKLKGCSRQLGGEPTRHNTRGTWIRSYVVAEHHNQLVSAILNVENFVGFNFDPRQETLDWRIRNLRELKVIFDDYNCPDVSFTFNIVEDDAETGVLANYFLQITPPGIINNFRLDFGDGEFTTTDLEGQHRYAVNARIDPVVTVANDKCQVIQTPIERANPAEPPPAITEVFEIPIPNVPPVPDFTLVPCVIPEPEVNLPPLVFPCISIEGQIGPIPSVITGPDINLVSNITITGPTLNLPHSVITIIGNIDVPDVIIIDPPIPPTIIIDPPIPPTIIIIPPDSNIVLDLDIANIPKLEIDWGNMPPMEMTLAMAKQVKSPSTFAVDQDIVNEFGEEFADLFQASSAMKVEYETVSIPSEIMIIPPSQMPEFKIDTTGIPKKIKVDARGVNIPKDIVIHGPESPIPDVIRFDNLPESMDLVYRGTAIPIDASSIPTRIILEVEKPLPEKILVEMVSPIPERIMIDHNIPDHIDVFGVPSTIEVMGFPEGIPVIFPEKMPEIELVYRGAPFELKVTMDEILPKDGEGKNCVMIVPCPTS